MNESETRAELIDPKLNASGWGVDADDVRVYREYKITAGEIQADGGRAKRYSADYVLEYKNSKLAVIEAKSDEVSEREGVTQATLYADKLGLQTSFATNGKEILQITHRGGGNQPTIKKITKFPPPDKLWQDTFGNASEWRQRLSQAPFDIEKTPRYYQELAINRALQAIADDQKRILLTLATGTGKTFIAFQIAWKLFQSNWTLKKDQNRQPRILFLTDRNILAHQTRINFGAFGESLIPVLPRAITRNGEVPKNGNVFVALFQTLMSKKQGAPYFTQYPSNFFDLVIIDECHRGGARDKSNWREMLDYFAEAVQLGMTATPKRNDNVDTYEYFGKPVFEYRLIEGIQDGFLTPFVVQRITSNIDEYKFELGDEIEDGAVDEQHNYQEPSFNVSIEIKQREQHRVQQLLAAIEPNEKTIVFCRSQEHAALVRDLINAESKSDRADYCVRITANDGDIGEIYFKQFQDNEKTIPTIVTTSQKLATGVDVLNLRNIALLRRINSMVDFKQIIGRGTRVFEGKGYFTIVDFVGACEKFNDEEWDGPPIKREAQSRKKLSKKRKHSARAEMVRVKLSDGRVIELQSHLVTFFYLDARTVGADEFINHVFNTMKEKLPEIFEGNKALRKVWADPTARKNLLQKLQDKGIAKAELAKLLAPINAQDGELLDVLEHIAHSTTPMSRVARVEAGKQVIFESLPDEWHDFVGTMLRHYIDEGGEELDLANFRHLVKAKYGSVDAATQELGELHGIHDTFVNFQQHLYNPPDAQS